MSREHIFPARMRELFPDMDEVNYRRSIENLVEGGPVEEDNGRLRGEAAVLLEPGTGGRIAAAGRPSVILPGHCGGL